MVAIGLLKKSNDGCYYIERIAQEYEQNQLMSAVGALGGKPKREPKSEPKKGRYGNTETETRYRRRERKRGNDTPEPVGGVLRRLLKRVKPGP
jgi:hypothetical protein